MYLTAEMVIRTGSTRVSEFFSLAERFSITIAEFKRSTDNSEEARCTCMFAGKRSFDQFIGTVDVSDAVDIVSVMFLSEESTRGGLIQTSSREPIESFNDLERILETGHEIVINRIEKGKGVLHSGVSVDVCVASIFHTGDDDPLFEGDQFLLQHLKCEEDALLLSYTTKCNGIPLVLNGESRERILQTFHSMKKNFYALYISDIVRGASSLYEDIIHDSGFVTISREYDIMPLLILILVLKSLNKKGIQCKDATIGIPFLSPGSIRLTKLLSRLGINRVLGFDSEDTLLVDFENMGGMATIEENVFGNSDFLLFLDKDLDDNEIDKLRPGQGVVTSHGRCLVHESQLKEKGISQLMVQDPLLYSQVFAGLFSSIDLFVDSNLDDGKLISIAQMLAGIVDDGGVIPLEFNLALEKFRKGLE